MRIIERAVELTKMCVKEHLDGEMFDCELEAHQFVITGLMHGEPVIFTGTVGGRFLPPNGGDAIQFTNEYAEIDGQGRAVVTLPDTCYSVQGAYGLVITLTSGDHSTVIYAATGFIGIGETPEIVDPGNVINVDAIEAYIYDCRVATASAQQAAAFVPNMIAPAFDASVSNTAGDYVTYDGKLYRITADRAANVTWSNTSKLEVTAGVGMKYGIDSLKVSGEAFENASEAYTGDRWLNFKYGRYSADPTQAAFFLDTNSYVSAFCPCQKGDKFLVDVYGGTGTAGGRAWVLYDSNLSAIASANSNTHFQGVAEILRDEAAYIAFNNLLANQASGYYAIKCDSTLLQKLAAKQDTLTFDSVPTAESNNPVKSGGVYSAIGDTLQEIDRVRDAVSVDAADMQFDIGKYYNSSGVVKNSSARSLGLSQIVTVHPGDMICVNVPATDANNVALVFGVHEFYKAEWVNAVTPTAGDIVTIPDGVDSVRFVFGRSVSTGIALTYADIKAYANAIIIKKKHGVFDGKRVSVIGTSDSTFAGYIPAENRVYYDGTNYGVLTVGQCWWHIGITENGGIPLINDSWSGSTVARGVRDASDYRPLVELSRCQNLHAYQHGGTSSDTLVTNENINTLRHSPWDDDQTAWTVGEYVKEIDPDVVIINGGGNDYTYAAPMGTYDGHTALADDDPLTSFREAYAALINRIQARYPYALVICCTPIFLVRPAMSNPPTETDRNQVNVNSANLTYYDYQSAIKEIATMKGCPVIDGFVHGFSRRNYYSLFCSDSSRNPVHPNALGHMVYGVDFAKNLRNCVFGLTDFA